MATSLKSKADFDAVLVRLRRNDPSLTEIGLGSYDFRIETNRFAEQDFERLAEALAENTHLLSLDLMGPYEEIFWTGTSSRVRKRARAKGIRALSKGLIRNKTLKELRIRGGGIISDRDVATLFEALEQNNSVTTLGLSDNRLTDEGAIALSESLKTNSTLENLYLADNIIDDDGALALSYALKRNTTLKTLDLQENKIGNDGIRALMEMLKVNTTVSIAIKDGFWYDIDETTYYNDDGKLYGVNAITDKSLLRAAADIFGRNEVLNRHIEEKELHGAALYVQVSAIGEQTVSPWKKKARKEETSNKGKIFKWATGQWDFTRRDPATGSFWTPDVDAKEKEEFTDDTYDQEQYTTPLWEAQRGDGMTLKLVLDTFIDLSKSADNRDALKKLIETKTDEKEESLLHVAATRGSKAATDLCLFITEDLGVDMHKIIDRKSRSAFCASSETTPMLRKMSFLRMCRDAGRADSFVDALLDVVREPQSAESALYYVFREKPEVLSPSFLRSLP